MNLPVIWSDEAKADRSARLRRMLVRAKIGLLLLGAGLATLAPHLARSQSNTQPSREQTEFCDDGAPDDITIPSRPLPESVINAVMNSRVGKQAETDARSNQTELDPAKLLTGTTIRLSTGRSRFFLVKGTADLSGADNTWFWIVRESGGKAISLGWFGANCLQIRSTTTLGLRDVVSLWSSASATRTNTYEFNGRSYRLVRSRLRNH